MLSLLLLQLERSWTLHELATRLSAPGSSVHRELERAENSGLVTRDASSRPHKFQGARTDAIADAMALLLERSVGIETQLRAALEGLNLDLAVIHGSWASGKRRPDSDIDVLVVGAASMRELRSRVRPVGTAAGRTIDLTLFGVRELRNAFAHHSSFARGLLDGPVIPLVGDLSSLVSDG